MTFDTTVGGAQSNSYADVAYADAALATEQSWTGMTESDKGALLVRATSALEIKYRGKWIGQKATSTQRLAWPRARKIDTDQTMTDSDGVVLALDKIPDQVLQAQIEVARVFISGGPYLAQPSTKDQFVKRKKIDVLETEWFSGAPTQTKYPLIDQILYGLASGVEGGVPTVEFNLLLSDREKDQSTEYSVFDDARYFNKG